MFGRKRNFNDFFRDFDAMFNQFDSMFNNHLNLNRTIEEGSDEQGNWIKETYKSEDGETVITNFIRTNDRQPNQRIKKGGNKIDMLNYQLEMAIENEDFESAVKLRDQIKSLEKNKEKIDSLESDLKLAIKEHNFEKAIEIRDELKKLKS
jgi:hypothetical protein